MQAKKFGFITVLALTLPLVACGSDPEVNSANSADNPVTITYMNFTSNGGNEENLDAIVKAFEAENPNINVEVTTFPYADYFTTLQTDLAGGTVADIFDIEYANYAAYQSSGVLAKLDDVDTSVYQQSLAQAYMTDGTPYALPTSFSNVVLFYNKDLFDKAGLNYPTSEWTWKDEQEAAEKITNPQSGIWGDYQPISYHEYYKAIVQAGGTLLNDDMSAVTFNSPEGKAAAEWLIEKSGKTMPTSEQGAGTPDFDTSLFADGKLGMWHSGIWMFGALDDATFDWDIAVEPGKTQKASAMFSNAVAVSSQSENKEAAIAFATYLTSSDTTVDVRLKSGWELPTIADQVKLQPYLKVTPPQNKQAVFDSLESVALAPSIGDRQAEMEDIITEELTEAAAGRKTVDDALSSAEKRVNALLN